MNTPRTLERGLQVGATFSPPAILRRSFARWLVELGVEGERVEWSEDLDGCLRAPQDGSLLLLLIRPEDWAAEGEVNQARRVHSMTEAATAFVTKLEQFEAEAGREVRILFCPPTDAARRDPAWLKALDDVEQSVVTSMAASDHIHVLEQTTVQVLAGAEQAGDDVFYAGLAAVLARQVYDHVGPPLRLIVVEAEKALWREKIKDGKIGRFEVHAAGRCLQDALLQVADRGALLAAISHGGENSATSVFDENPEMLMHRNDLVALLADDRGAAVKLGALMEQLAVTPGEILFLSNDEKTCAEIEAAYPDVLAVTLPPIAGMRHFLRHLWPLDSVADEGPRSPRGDHEVESVDVDETNLEQAAALTQNTQVLNCTVRRFTEEQLKDWLNGKSRTARLVKPVKGERGKDVWGLVMVEKIDEMLLVHNFLAADGGDSDAFEEALLRLLASMAEDWQCEEIRLPFLSTPANGPARRLFEEKLGLTAARLPEEGWLVFTAAPRKILNDVLQPRKTEKNPFPAPRQRWHRLITRACGPWSRPQTFLEEMGPDENAAEEEETVIIDGAPSKSAKEEVNMTNADAASETPQDQAAEDNVEQTSNESMAKSNQAPAANGERPSPAITVPVSVSLPATERVPDQTLVHRLDDVWRRFADATVIREGDVTWTYRELENRSRLLANVLSDRGVGPDSVVGVCCNAGIDALVAVLGVLRCGGVVFPLNPSMECKCLVPFAQHFEISHVVCPLRKAGALQSAGLPSTYVEVFSRYVSSEVTVPDAEPALSLTADSPAWVVGRAVEDEPWPRATCLTHGNIMMAITNEGSCLTSSPDDTTAFWSPAYSPWFLLEILGTLLGGGALQVPPREAAVSAEACVSWLASSGVTRCFARESEFAAMVLADDEQRVAMPALRRVFLWGNPLMPEDSETSWVHRFDLEQTACCRMVLWEEALGAVLSAPVSIDDENETRYLSNLSSDVGAYVLGGTKRPVLAGVWGDLYWQGPAVAPGYLHQKDLSDQHFVPDPVQAESLRRCFRTGVKARFLPESILELAPSKEPVAAPEWPRMDWWASEHASLDLEALNRLARQCVESLEVTADSEDDDEETGSFETSINAEDEADFDLDNPLEDVELLPVREVKEPESQNPGWEKEIFGDEEDEQLHLNAVDSKRPVKDVGVQWSEAEAEAVDANWQDEETRADGDEPATTALFARIDNESSCLIEEIEVMPEVAAPLGQKDAGAASRDLEERIRGLEDCVQDIRRFAFREDMDLHWSLDPEWELEKDCTSPSAGHLTETQRRYLEDVCQRYTMATRHSREQASGRPPSARAHHPLLRSMSHDLLIESAAGSVLVDADGNQLRDWSMNDGNRLLGHGSPAILHGMEAQAREPRGAHTLAREFREMLTAILHVEDALALPGETEAFRLLGRVFRRPERRRLLALTSPVEARDGLRFPGCDVMSVTGNECVEVVRQRASEWAAVIIDGALDLPLETVLSLYALSVEHDIAFIVDERLSGFRAQASRAAVWTGIEPAASLFGAVLADGMPMAALAGAASWVQACRDHIVSTEVHPMILATACRVLATIREEGGEGFDAVRRKMETIVSGLSAAAAAAGADVRICPHPARASFSIETPAETLGRDLLLYHLRLQGIFFDDLRGFVVRAHGDDDVSALVASVGEVLGSMTAAGFMRAEAHDVDSEDDVDSANADEPSFQRGSAPVAAADDAGLSEGLSS